MKELPILFSPLMSEANLKGSKSETRRTRGLNTINYAPNDFRLVRFEVNPTIVVAQDSLKLPRTKTAKGNYAIFEQTKATDIYLIKCPYGQPGDLLWVRERFETDTDGFVRFFAGNIEVEHNRAYRRLTKWSPSIHLPKADARQWLEVVEIGVERVRDITEAGAMAEGVERSSYTNQTTYKDYVNSMVVWTSPVRSFQSLWESINGPDSWEYNPWVWVVKYRTLSRYGRPVGVSDSKLQDSSSKNQNSKL